MDHTSACPTPERLKRILHGDLAEPEERDLNRHLAGCPTCQHALDRLVLGDEFATNRIRGYFARDAAAEPALEDAIAELKAAGSRSDVGESNQVDLATSLEFLDAPQRPGTLGRLGHYEILDVVGRGGMGIVLKAFDSSLRRVVAIKVLARHLADNASARRRFTREAQAAAAVSHDHIVTIHAVEAANDPPFLVMQFVDGKSLQQRIDQTGPLELKKILRIGVQTAAGLAAAHAQGLVHRDIKPANILLENGIERVKITDFGLARADDDAGTTETGIVAGTPQFMAPEQAEGSTVDHRADLFSLGGVLYAMCTGRPPFRSSTTMGVLKHVCEAAPRPIREINPDMPTWLVAIVDRLHAKRPAERFQSAGEVAELLGRHLAELQHVAAPPLGGPPTPGAEALRARGVARTGRTPRRLGMVALGLALLVAAFGLSDAAGWTQIGQQVIRIVRGEGTVIVEVDDPEVTVTIGGQSIVIRDANSHEIRLSPGAYQLVATKDGRPEQSFPITLSRGGRQTVRVRFEGIAAAADARRPAASDPILHAPQAPVPLRKLVAGHAGAWRVAVSPDGRWLVTTGADSATGGVVRLWDAQTLEEKWRIEEDHRINAVAISPDGIRLATGEDDHTVKVRDMASGNVQDIVRGPQDSVRGVAFSRDSRWLVCATRARFVHEWDLQRPANLDPRPRWVLPGSTGPLESVAVSPDGRFVAAGGEDKRVRVWDRRTGDIRWTLPGAAADEGGTHTGPRPDDKITAVAYSPDGRTLAASSMDQLVYLWDTATGKLDGVLKRHTRGVSSVAYSSDGRWMATAGWDGTAVVWDAASRRPLATFDSRENQCFGVVFIDAGRQLATAHRNGQLMIWDVAATIASGPDPVTTEQSDRTAATDTESRVRSLERQLDELRNAVRDLSVLAAAAQLAGKDKDPSLSDAQRAALLQWIAAEHGPLPQPSSETGTPAGSIPALDELVRQRIARLADRPDSDDVFMRRVYLDLLGTPPTEAEFRMFVNDRRPSPQKRAELIDRLLSAPAFSERWSELWRDVLRRAAPAESTPSNEMVRRTWQRALDTQTDVVFDTDGFKSTYELVDQDYDSGNLRMTWTLQTKQRSLPWYGYHAVVQDAQRQTLLEDAPLFWSSGKRSGQDVELATLDLRWVARRLGSRDRVDAARRFVIERYEEGPLGESVGQESVPPRTIATGIFGDGVVWVHSGFEGLYQVLDVSHDSTTATVTWKLSTKRGFYPSRLHRVVFYTRTGERLGTDAPLIWSRARAFGGQVEIVTLDVGYFGELLGPRAAEVATIVVERYPEKPAVLDLSDSPDRD